MAKILCGRYDCAHEFSGKCQLGTISIGKDCTCQLFHGTNGEAQDQFKRDTLSMQEMCKRALDKKHKKEEDTVFQPIPLREQL